MLKKILNILLGTQKPRPAYATVQKPQSKFPQKKNNS